MVLVGCGVLGCVEDEASMAWENCCVVAVVDVAIAFWVPSSNLVST